MRAIAIQCEPGADKAVNIAMMRRLIDGAVIDGPALISLPEMWTCLGADRATKLSQSEVLPAAGQAASLDTGGPAYRFLSDTARRLGVVLHGGSIGERENDTLYNTSLVFGPDGRELARYRKIHLFDAVTASGRGYRESALFGAGDTVVTCAATAAGDTLTLGLSICYDVRFAELYLALRRAGASVILVPAAFTVETGRDHWEVLLRARAIETQCWIIAAATVGTHYDAARRARETYGHSLICDPWGEIRACLPSGEGSVAVELDMQVTARVRAAMPVLAHRRLA